MLFTALLNTDLDEIKQYLSVGKYGNFDSIKPHIAAAEQLYMKDILGKDLYSQLSTWYNDQQSHSFSSSYDTTAADLNSLLPHVQLPLILFAYHLGADEMSVHLSDQGIQIMVDDNHKQAFQWQVEGVKSSWINKAHIFTEVLLEYLEENVDKYAAWKHSAAYTDQHELFINTAEQFNEDFYINRSRRLFVAMKPIIKNTEIRYLIPSLSKGLFDLIKTEIKANNLSDDNAALLPYIRPALVHLAMSRAITELSIEVLPEGIFENLVSSFSTQQGKNPAKAVSKSAVAAKLHHDGQAELIALSDYLDANASEAKYPLYFESTSYRDPANTTSRTEFENSTDKGIFVV